jgi:peptidylprolyl isomerase
MRKVKHGDEVKVMYSVRNRDGVLLESNLRAKPLLFIAGDNHYLPAFEQAVIGMVPGEIKHFEIPMNLAFGPHDKLKIMVLRRDELPESANLEEGSWVSVPGPEKTPIKARIVALDKDVVALDGNHPFAGQDLILDIHLLGLKEPVAAEGKIET